MKAKRKDLVTVWLFVGVLLVGGIVLQGCKESEPSGSGASSEKKEETDGQKWTCPMHPQVITDRPSKCPTCGMDLVPQEAEKKPGAMKMPAKEIAVAAGQTMCPIMNLAINKDLFTEYKGKKVYFCCPGCKPEFEKYLAKLPQFKN